MAAIDRGMVTLAHEGPVRYRERFELVDRREAERPNPTWQADHTQLEHLILDHAGRPARPWLTVILDDHSRALAGYAVGLDVPSALQTALALRQAIWRKTDPSWPVCGIPDVLYSDHGSDFTSRHLEQVCLDLRVELIHSTAGVPQGRGKIERFFGTIATELLPRLPGHLSPGNATPATAPQLSLAELDEAIGRFVITDYHARAHTETVKRRASAGWPMDGCHGCPNRLSNSTCCCSQSPNRESCTATGSGFWACRYLDLTLAAYVGEPVTNRYDPRDLGEIRVYHHGRFLCRAIAPELADQTISLRDLQAARNTRRRGLRAELDGRLALAEQILPRNPAPPPTQSDVRSENPRRGPRLKRYRND